jgi:hypothetical protein
VTGKVTVQSVELAISDMRLLSQNSIVDVGWSVEINCPQTLFTDFRGPGFALRRVQSTHPSGAISPKVPDLQCFSNPAVRRAFLRTTAAAADHLSGRHPHARNVRESQEQPNK